MPTVTREEQQHDAVRPQPQPLEDIVRRLTDDGQLIVGFLVTTMQGDIPDVTPSHQLQAARILIKLGFSNAELPDDNSSNSPARMVTGEPRRRGSARRSRLDAELARFARDETDGGREAIRFLVDVMQGNVPDFKPCHRLAAARELLRRGFDRHGSPDAQTESGPGVQSQHDSGPQSEPEHEQDAEPQPEVPEGFRLDPDGIIVVDWMRGIPITPVETLFHIPSYVEHLRMKKAEGIQILRPDWWQEGLEEFVDENSLTLREAILEAAEAEGITIEPHLLPEDGPRPQASAEEDSEREDLAPEAVAEADEEAAPEEEPEPGPAVRDEDTNVPWSKPGYHYRDELSAHEKKVLERGGTLHWYNVERRFP